MHGPALSAKMILITSRYADENAWDYAGFCPTDIEFYRCNRFCQERVLMAPAKPSKATRLDTKKHSTKAVLFEK
jgi:hypothetical protein